MRTTLVILAVLILVNLGMGQYTSSPVVYVTGALPQDSLNVKVDKKDTSATSGIPAMYVTPTMLNLRMLKADSSAVSGTATKYTTPTMMGLRVLRSDSSITTGVVGYVTSTMGATLLTKSDSSVTSGTATKYVTPTMAVGTFLSKSDSSATPSATKYTTPTMLATKAAKWGGTNIDSAYVSTAEDSLIVIMGSKRFGMKRVQAY